MSATPKLWNSQILRSVLFDTGIILRYFCFSYVWIFFLNLQNSLAYVTPGDPYSFKALQSGNTPLPTLSEPGIAFLEINGHPMVFLVGGHDAGDADRPTSDVIAIHTIHREWWYVKFENDENGDYPTPAARITSVVVGCNDHLYIFGGIERFEDDGNWTHQRTFSVLEFQEDAHKARWVAMDVPYPIDVPREHVFGKAVAVQNGTMILLLPGRAKQDIVSIGFFYQYIP